MENQFIKLSSDDGIILINKDTIECVYVERDYYRNKATIVQLRSARKITVTESVDVVLRMCSDEG